ncbi:MAG: choice-of-anchor B family protein [Saprospiraceae bacterium]|nr:choice-of-anchor B family protein [Saprospiraceae bacterium]
MTNITKLSLFLILIVLFSAFNISQLNAQKKENLQLMSHIDFGEGGSGIWGHTDANGIEYAVIGTRQAIRILSLEDPANPIERLVIPGATNSWREMRSWGNYIYVTTEGPDGVTIIDATNAPNQFTWKRWKPAIPNTVADTLRTVHSINMDTLGFLYLNGHNVNRQGIIICDLNKDPYNPEIVSNMGEVYTHDCYANAQYLFTADLSNGVGVYDISNRSDPKFLTRFQTPNVFAHNVWTNPEGTVLYTTDEVSGAYLASYDISDLNNVQFLDKYRNEDTQIGKVIPHNTYAVGQYAVTSWYTDGILIQDMTRPDNIVKVGEYDTYLNDSSLPQSGAWFYGCWGVYAHFASGTVIGSDINSGLWVFKPNYQRACYLEGNARAIDIDGAVYPIAGASIKIITDRAAIDVTNGSGDYKTGLLVPGTYQVRFQHPDYGVDTVEVTLQTAEITIKDFIFQANFITGRVVDQDGSPIANAGIQLENAASTTYLNVISSANGQFKLPVSREADYLIRAAAWGYKGIEFDPEEQEDLTIVLEPGYEDDFFNDLGWINSEKSAAGNWERVVPQGTMYQNKISNPDKDVSDDLGRFAYLTGNGGVNPGDNDVDGGATTLLSPFLDGQGADSLKGSFSYWFYNDGGSGNPNDYFSVYLDNGFTASPVLVELTSASEWKKFNFAFAKNQVTMTDKMRLVVKAEDITPGHLVEAGIDQFKLDFFKTTSSSQDLQPNEVTAAPNPVSSFFNIHSLMEADLVITRTDGMQVHKSALEAGNNVVNVQQLVPGLYFATIHAGGSNKVIRFIKM